jgi:hypothetical protein
MIFRLLVKGSIGKADSTKLTSIFSTVESALSDINTSAVQSAENLQQLY